MLKQTAIVYGIIMVITIIMPNSVLAQDWYVDGTNGDDNYSAWRVHDGFDCAYRTIGQAVRSAAAGDVIKVAAGTYTEYVALDKAVSIIGESGAIIDGLQREQCGVAIQGVDGVTLTNLAFVNCSYGVYISSAAATISNCVFKDNASGIFVYDPADKPVSVTGSAFIRNGNAIHSYYHSSNVAVSNCDFVDNGTALYRQWSGNDYRVQQSIFADNSRTFWYRDPQSGSAFDPPTVSQSNFYANSDGYAPANTTRARMLPAEQNLAVDPQFADKDNDNLFLLATSPMLLTDARQQTVLIGAYGIAEQQVTEEGQVLAEENIVDTPIVLSALPPTMVEQITTPQLPVTLTLAVVPQVVVIPAVTEVQPTVTVVTPPAVATPVVEPMAPITDTVAPSVPVEPTQEQIAETIPIISEPVQEETVPVVPVVVDTLAPESILSTDLPEGALKAVPETELTLTATDPAERDGNGSGVARIEYRVNGGNWMAYAAPFELHKVMDGATRGILTIGYRAIDRQGNIETEKTAGFEVQPALSVSARLLTVPRVLCWWNGPGAPSEPGGEGIPSREVWRKPLAAVLDTSALDYRIVERGSDFLAGLPDYNVYLILGDREKLDRAGSAALAGEVAGGRSVLSFGYERIATLAEDDRGWENIFGVKVAGVLKDVVLNLPGSAISDTRSVALAGQTAKVTAVLGGEVWGEAGEMQRENHGRVNGNGNDRAGNATSPAIVAGAWEQGKTLYVSADYARNQAALADLLRRAILWAEPAGVMTDPGDAVAVGITVTNAVLPMQLQVNVEGHPGDGCEVLKVFDGGERRAGYAVWFDDLQQGADGNYRLILRRQGVAACRISVDAYYLDGRSFCLSETNTLCIQ